MKQSMAKRGSSSALSAAFCLFLGGCHAGFGQGLPDGFERIELQVDGAARTGVLYAPASAAETPAPLVFVFHGHGGRAEGMARTFPMYKHWPEAISVYLQGLNTPGRLTDPEGKRPGWQHDIGAQGDRDLKFFDAALAHVKGKFKMDEKRIYCTGHSNGGGFTYLLWAARGHVFAAVAPSAAAAAGRFAKDLKPKPAMHLAGENDKLVKFEWQKATMEAVRALNGCDAEGQPWAPLATLYPSKGGTPFVAFIHPGAHGIAPGAPELIVRFFKEHPR